MVGSIAYLLLKSSVWTPHLPDDARGPTEDFSEPSEMSGPTIAENEAGTPLQEAENQTSDPLPQTIDVTPVVQGLVQRGTEALSNGQFELAVNLLTSAGAIDPTIRFSRTAIADALAAWGWSQITGGEYEGAVTVFQRGLSEVQDHASSLTGLGYVYARLRRDDDSIAVLLRAAQVDPANSRIHQWLGEVYDRRNDLEQAMASYRRALALSPGDAGLAARVARLEREGARHGAFVQAVTRHFTIQFDGHENRDLHRVALGILEEAYGEIGRAFGFFPGDATTVILYSRQQFTDITRTPQWTGALFDGKIRIPTDGYEVRPDAFKRVLFHEYVHALIHAKTGAPVGRLEARQGPRVPVWLHEGLAQYFEPSTDSRSGREQRVSAGEREGQRVIPFASLESSFMSFTESQAETAYAQSRSMVGYLIDRYGMDRINRLLDRLANHQTIDAACRDVLSISYDRLERAWRDAAVGSDL
jgi:tetratricopeptide (TPR) repeat protein